jgi:diguanylate cyclase (GGDEF)-like protein
MMQPHDLSTNFDAENSYRSDEKPLVLIVEDSRTQAAVLKHLLQQNGYEAVVASDGREALVLAHQRKPALVVSDILMPIMDGYATCHAIKAEATLAEVPVMLLTSLSDTTDIVKGLQAGADYYLTKPYDSSYLVSMIKSIISQKPQNHMAMNEAIEVEVEGQNYLIGAGRRQMLNLLLSTYSNAVIQNRILLQTQHELRSLNAQLTGQREQIELQQRELREANMMLRNQATRDSLTNLRNFRAFKERLAEEIERTRRHQEPLSLLLLDVDRFKQFNDSFGHPAGDEVLYQVARLMEEQARGSDFVARYGGEEFVILLPNTPEEQSRAAAERVRIAIENGPWKARQVTASIGVATTNAETDEATLLAQADIALYASKASGRNCITHIADMPPNPAK